MLAQRRQALILDQILRSGSVRVSELTTLLGVSDMTVRRDLEQLAAEGRLHKVHGGAVLEGPPVPGRVLEEPSFADKSELQRPAKEAIAARAAQLLEPGTAIAVSAGTTTWCMAKHIAAIPSLTVVTNSITFAETVGSLGDPLAQTVILTGGVRTPSAALVGPVADLTIRSLHVDHLFIGAYGFDTETGLTSPNLAEAETNRILISRAQRVVVLADSTKWRNVGLASWGGLDDADVLITDDLLKPAVRAELASTGTELILVSPDGTDPS